MGNRGVKDEKISWKHIAVAGGIGILLFYGNGWLLGMNVATTLRAALYTATLLAGFLGMLAAGLWSSRLLKNRMTDDPFNAENESFMQETRLLKNDDSFNFPTEFVFRRRRHSGWINVVNPFRASIVLGTPGSGKILCPHQQLHQAGHRKGICALRLRLQVRRPVGYRL